MLISPLYGMIDHPPDAERARGLARGLISGGVRVFQIRMKNVAAASLLSAVRAVQPLCKEAGALLIVNDRLDVALAAEADGVHLGQEDLPLPAARRLVPSYFCVGISTHNRTQAEAAFRGGANYIGFGPCFPTRSKESPDPQVTLDELAEVCRLPLPVVAIGGITLQTMPLIARAGAQAAAAISAIQEATDVASTAEQLISAHRMARPS